MSDLERCVTCSGRKQILSLGGMMKDCYSCVGVGWVKKQSYSDIELDGLTNAAGDPVKAVKRRGRKPKAETE